MSQLGEAAGWVKADRPKGPAGSASACRAGEERLKRVVRFGVAEKVYGAKASLEQRSGCRERSKRASESNE